MSNRKLSVFHVGALSLAALFSLAALPAAADTVIITTDTLVNDGDSSLDGRDVIVRGATLTINGAHAVNSLTVERSPGNMPGVVTHTVGFTNGTDNGLKLTVAGNVLVQGIAGNLVGSRLDVDGHGFLAQQGPGAGGNAPSGYAGGGGHGGAGGIGTGALGGASGAAYDSFTTPISFGSGGGDGAGGPGFGGAGGGVIRLIVLGTLTVDGSISANGNTSAYYYSGGGAGGSVWINCGTLSGSGVITAHGGGVLANSPSGSGGGGRIAVYANSSSFSDVNLRAYSAAPQTGGAGTVYFRPTSIAPETLIIDNNALPFVQSVTQMTGNVTVPQNLLVRNGGCLGAALGDSSLHLTVQGDATIASGGRLVSLYATVLGNATVASGGGVDADGRGYSGTQGPGAGGNAPSGYGGGGGHGGAGGNGTGAAGGASGEPYGSFTLPTTPGSGGGDGAGGPGYAGAGGGVIRMAVTGTLTVDGTISANGSQSSYYYSGGGAGGSIWIECGTLNGSGMITANGAGALAGSPSGSGSGGRIAVYANSSSFNDSNIRAYGGGVQIGGAGTVYVRPSSSAPETLIIDNGGQALVQSLTQMSGNITIPQNLLVRNGGHLGSAVGNDSLHLTVLGDAMIATGGVLDAESRGYTGNQGPATGGNAPSGYAGGGGHGGKGGDGTGATGGIGGAAYGSSSNPVTMGSGGGNGAGGPGYAGAGGGVVRLTVGGTLTVNGTIDANGGNSTYYYSGGGAGGSIWIDCGILTGSGTITANGGSILAGSPSGSGGGGRIAVYSCQVLMSPAQVTANTGPGSQPGDPGTVYFLASSIDILQQPQSQVIQPGQSAMFSVMAQSQNAMQYQWRRNSVLLADDSHISGSHTPTLSVINANCFNHSGVYDVIVTDQCGFVVSQPVTLGVRYAADINGDCFVNIDDLVQVITHWGACPQPCPAYCPADVVQDCTVNIDDLVNVITHWG